MKTIIIIGLWGLCWLGLSLSYAGESIHNIAENKHKKKLFISAVSQQIKLHQTLSMAEIKKQLERKMISNLALLRVHGLDSRKLSQKVLLAISYLRDLQEEDRDLLLDQEKLLLKRLQTANNYTFQFTREFKDIMTVGMAFSDNSPWLRMGGSIVYLFTISFDLLFFPVAFLASAFSGF